MRIRVLAGTVERRNAFHGIFMPKIDGCPDYGTGDFVKYTRKQKTARGGGRREVFLGGLLDGGAGDGRGHTERADFAEHFVR